MTYVKFKHCKIKAIIQALIHSADCPQHYLIKKN